MPKTSSPSSVPEPVDAEREESRGNVAAMAGRLRQGGAPTRRFHVPSAVRGSAARIDAATARELIADGALLVDVRRKDDPAVTLGGALRIPPDEISRRLDEFSRDTPIVLACG
jgi:hypothetical protein